MGDFVQLGLGLLTSMENMIAGVGVESREIILNLKGFFFIPTPRLN